MIASLYRFHGHGSLRFAYRRGKNVRGQYFAIKCILNKRRKNFRASVVVSKKVSKSAVKRNRIRRRIYEIIRVNSGIINQPFDIVIVVFSDQLVDMDHNKLENILLDQLQQAGVLSYKERDV